MHYISVATCLGSEHHSSDAFLIPTILFFLNLWVAAMKVFIFLKQRCFAKTWKLKSIVLYLANLFSYVMQYLGASYLKPQTINTYIHIRLHKKMRNTRDQFWHNFMSQLATWRVVIGKDVSPHDPLTHPYQLPLVM